MNIKGQVCQSKFHWCPVLPCLIAHYSMKSSCLHRGVSLFECYILNVSCSWRVEILGATKKFPVYNILNVSCSWRVGGRADECWQMAASCGIVCVLHWFVWIRYAVNFFLLIIWDFFPTWGGGGGGLPKSQTFFTLKIALKSLKLLKN